MYRRSGADSAKERPGPLRLERPLRANSIVAAIVLATAVAACDQGASEQPVDVAVIDSVMAELGGTLTANLERGQRWRMISSIGVGLPPNDFQPEELPEPGSRGAGLLQVYCVQCHWLPTPQMHSAAEWPILVRRNLLRMQQLKDRLGGPLTTGLVGEVVLAGYESAEFPAPQDVDTLLDYLQRYALPVAQPGELTPGPGRALFVEKCSICHETPSPRAHTVTGWERLIGEMQAIMAVSDVQPLTSEELDSITAYLRSRATR
jgi:mono/diheme cytochrome c family protein